jgi:hypothetical protein
MQRRESITLLGSAVAGWPFSRAAAGKLPTIWFGHLKLRVAACGSRHLISRA